MTVASRSLKPCRAMRSKSSVTARLRSWAVEGGRVAEVIAGVEIHRERVIARHVGKGALELVRRTNRATPLTRIATAPPAAATVSSGLRGRRSSGSRRPPPTARSCRRSTRRREAPTSTARRAWRRESRRPRRQGAPSADRAARAAAWPPGPARSSPETARPGRARRRRPRRITPSCQAMRARAARRAPTPRAQPGRNPAGGSLAPRGWRGFASPRARRQGRPRGRRRPERPEHMQHGEAAESQGPRPAARYAVRAPPPTAAWVASQKMPSQPTRIVPERRVAPEADQAECVASGRREKRHDHRAHGDHGPPRDRQAVEPARPDHMEQRRQAARRPAARPEP